MVLAIRCHVQCTCAGFAAFSAVCWYFGKNTFNALDGEVPIGLVGSFVGGTSVERWSSPDALAHCNQTGVVDQSNLWDPYIVPLLPMCGNFDISLGHLCSAE